MMSSMRRSASSPGLMPCSPTDTEAEMSELLAMRGGVTYERRVPGSPAEMDIWYDVKPSKSANYALTFGHVGVHRKSQQSSATHPARRR